LTTAQPAAPAANDERLPQFTKIAFGIGGAAETIALFSLTTYAMFFYNQVLGMPAWQAGLALALGLILDAFVDPFVGSLSDRTNSKWGRRHPYMFAAPIPIALAFFAVFNPPAGVTGWTLFAWFSGSVILLRCSMAFFHVPHLALGGELSPNYVERTRVMAWNNFLVFAGGASISIIALSVFFRRTPQYENGLLNPEGYLPFSIVAALGAMSILFFSAWFTRDRIPTLPKPPPNLPKFSPFEFFGDMGKAFSNINYVWLLVAYLFLSVMVGVRGGLNLYVGSHIFELIPEDLRWYVLGSLTGYLVALIFSARWHGRYDKRTVILWSAVIYAIAPGLPVTLRLLGLFWDNDHALLLPSLVAISAFSYGSAAVLTISVMSALADVADENEAKFGMRQEGVLYATRALFAKVDQAIGSALAGVALTVIAFPERAQPGTVPQDILRQLAWIEGPLAAIPGLMAVYFYARYRINEGTYAQTRALLEARRTRPAEALAIDADGPDPAGGVSPAPAPVPPRD
jgi:glycoside/pentoside/hexuronide:cation symporter, GPH family